MANLAVARAYQKSFHSRPNTTLAVTGGSLNALGDFIAQSYQNIYGKQDHSGPARYDIDRTLRFFCFGFAISPLIGRWKHFSRTPISSSCFSWFRQSQSESTIPEGSSRPDNHGSHWGSGLFLSSMGVMEGRTIPQIKQKFSDLYSPALITNWQVWPIAQLINFRFMPLSYRVPFQSTCGIFWTLYLSIINSREDHKQDRETKLRKTLDT